MKIKCPLCGFENEEGNKFCKNCNEPLTEYDEWGKVKRTTSKLLEDVLEEKRREIIKELIKDKKISFELY